MSESFCESGLSPREVEIVELQALPASSKDILSKEKSENQTKA